MKLWLQRILYRFCVACRPHSSRTVRVAFPLILVSVGLVGAATVLTQNTSYLVLNPSKNAIQEGDRFSIDVFVFAHQPVNAIDISIAYPPSQATITGIDAGASVITLWTEEPYFENNTVYLRGGTFRKGFQGQHFIARINAEAKQSGIASIEAENIRLLAGDGSGSEVAVTSQQGQSSVQIQIANENGEVAGSVNIIKIISDIDGDGKVDLRDVSIFMSAWRNKDIIYDFNGDGRMTFRDFGIILADSFFK